MFGAIKRIFRKAGAANPAAPPAVVSTQDASTAPPPALPNDPAKPVGLPDPPAPSNGDLLSLSYAAILRQMPKELQGKAGSEGLTGSYFQVSVQQIVDQLPQGAVRVQFGDLRRSAPTGVFTTSSSHDGQMVDLPLSEIIPQLPVEVYQRPMAQKCLLPPDEVTDLFGPKGQCMGTPRILPKNEVTRRPVPPRPKTAPHTGTGPGFNTSFSVQAPPVSRPPVSSGGVAAPRPTSNNLPTSMAFKTTTSRGPAARMASPTTTNAIPKSITESAPSRAKPLPKPNPRVTPATVEPASDSPTAGIDFSKPASTVPGEERRLGALPFLVDLAELAVAWPDPIREEIAQLHLPHARVELPAATVCDGLKRGRVQFTWGQLRAWIPGTPPPDAPSPHSQFSLDLPLNVLTPQFLDYIRATPLNRKVASAEHITEFFRRATEPTTSAVTAAAPAPPSSNALPSENATPTGGQTLSVSLTVLTAGWPEAILHEIQQYNLSDCRVELPTVETEAKLKTGKVDFLWQQLASWIHGCPQAVLDSPHGSAVLNLPLSVLAPLFLRRRSGATQFSRRPPSDLGIPDVFQSPGTLAPAAEVEAPRRTRPTPEAKPAPGPKAPVSPTGSQPPEKATPPSASAPVPASARKSPANLAELFGKPGKKTWTPKELVQVTRQLPGVAGALIALHDGLLVAQSMPDNWKTDATAAFLPQIFGRINQCAKELNTGEVQAVGITTPAGMLQVYQAGIVYFAALSQTGTNLPLDDLQIVANELGRRTN